LHNIHFLRFVVTEAELSLHELRIGENEMPIVRRSLREILKSKPDVDWEKIRNTTEEDIERMRIEDDVAPDHMYGPPRLVDPTAPDVRAIRRKLRLSQAQFARRFGFSVRTIQEWEQGRALPDRPARILLRVIEKSPKTVARAVAEL
jgi:putative transcriptional regulator